jgi:hypothetical protein
MSADYALRDVVLSSALWSFKRSLMWQTMMFSTLKKPNFTLKVNQ